MDNDKIIFLRANNGVIVEIHHRTWDGSNVDRYLFPYEDDKLDGDVLAEAINLAFNKRIEAKYLLKIPAPAPTS